MHLLLSRYASGWLMSPPQARKCAFTYSATSPSHSVPRQKRSASCREPEQARVVVQQPWGCRPQVRSSGNAQDKASLRASSVGRSPRFHNSREAN